MSKICFCGISKNCGYQIKIDMKQHDKVVFEEGYNKAMDKMLYLQKEMSALKTENAELHNEAQVEYAFLAEGDAEVRAKAIDEFAERMKVKVEKILKNTDIAADCKKCTIWKVRDIDEIANQLAEEYNNDFCKWSYDEFEEKWETDCGTLFALHDSDKEITHFCPCCGKKIKVVE